MFHINSRTTHKSRQLVLMVPSISLVLFFFLIWVNIAQSQIISRFSWDSNPVTNADVGPNAISVSSSATSSAGGVGATNGLNAGLPKLDIDLVIKDSAIFDVAGIEVSFDYQRDESQGTFFSRGNSLIIDGTSQLSVSYRVDDGVGGFTTVSSGNAYAIPNDNTFRNYRFYYLPGTGYGSLRVDGVEVWSNDGPDNRNLYWTGAGNINIGTAMDGSGSNQTFFDNFIIAEITNFPLPIELLTFDAIAKEQFVELRWRTATEINNNYFSIERSVDAVNWNTLSEIEGAGNSTEVIDYATRDESPLTGTSYYRLKQTDFNGEYSYSQIEAVQIKERHKEPLYPFPNPANNQIAVSGLFNTSENLAIYDVFGRNMTAMIVLQNFNESAIIIDISSLSPGIYYLNVDGRTGKFIKE